MCIRDSVASPRHDTDYMESWLQLWDGTPGKSNRLPGYGWAFPLGDVTMNVGLGTVAPNAAALGKTDYRAMLETWLKGCLLYTSRCV